MFRPIAVVYFATLALSYATAQGDDSVDVLIKQLGSANSKIREAATKALLARPESEEALRGAVRSKDLEVSRRAASIIEHFEERRSPLRELDKAIEAGRLERVIELLATMPEGKDERALWERVDKLSHALVGRANIGVKPKDDRYIQWRQRQPPDASVTAKIFSEKTPVPNLNRATVSLFVRAGEVDFDTARKENGRLQLPEGPTGWIISGGAVRLHHLINSGRVILAAGPVTQVKGRAGAAVIVSCADVKLELVNSGNILIIAKGNVDCRNANPHSCRIIAGKSVKIDIDRPMKGCVIEENEPNPLGFIRWSDPVKDKAAPKAK